MLRVITDTTCNLPPELIAAHHIPTAPIAIQFGEQGYDEFINLDRDLFYRRIQETGTIPTTSQPSPAWFAEQYRLAAQARLPVLVITVTSKHSGTHHSALLARSLVPEADVEVFDSASISLGTGWMVLEAAEMAARGATRSAILQRLGAIRRNSHLYLTPATLKYLQMSGRVGKLQGALASVLDVKPIIILQDGVLEARENVRTRTKALERLVALAQAAAGSAPVRMGIVHARAPEEGRKLLEMVTARLNCEAVLMEDLVPSLAVHGGPGVLGLAFHTL
ncbi:MAG: DegV family protein [Chloroflexi bacterium]|nr:DegV family protein [Chloroflexota bacterium]